MLAELPGPLNRRPQTITSRLRIASYDRSDYASHRFIGCDVGKSAIAVFDAGADRGFAVPNERDALDAFTAGLDTTCFVICEATGGHEAGLLDALVRAGRAVHRADARKVKAFIRSLGTVGKSDAIDARALARYAQERHDRLPLWQPRERVRDELQVTVTTRRDLVTERVACANGSRRPEPRPSQHASSAS